jgi:hypothetical protein
MQAGRYGHPSSPPRINRTSEDGSPYSTYKNAALTDFHVERTPKFPAPGIPIARGGMPEPGYTEEMAHRENLANLLVAQQRPSMVSGRIPIDASELVLFFRSKVCFPTSLLQSCSC